MKKERPAEQPMIPMPAKFWGTTTQEEFNEICDRGYLNAEECKRLWRMCDFQGEPPERLVPLIKEKDLERLIKR